MFIEAIKKDYNFYKLLDHLDILLEELSMNDEYDADIVKCVDDNVISWIKLLKEIKTAKK